MKKSQFFSRCAFRDVVSSTSIEGFNHARVIFAGVHCNIVMEAKKKKYLGNCKRELAFIEKFCCARSNVNNFETYVISLTYKSGY